MIKSAFSLRSPNLPGGLPSVARELDLAPAARAWQGVGTDSLSPYPTGQEETLVIDDRSGESPAQLVENKLTRKLRETTLPVSHLQMRGLLRERER